jgi:hypothetical protein
MRQAEHQPCWHASYTYPTATLSCTDRFPAVLGVECTGLSMLVRRGLRLLSTRLVSGVIGSARVGEPGREPARVNRWGRAGTRGDMVSWAGDRAGLIDIVGRWFESNLGLRERDGIDWAGVPGHADVNNLLTADRPASSCQYRLPALAGQALCWALRRSAWSRAHSGHMSVRSCAKR